MKEMNINKIKINNKIYIGLYNSISINNILNCKI